PKESASLAPTVERYGVKLEGAHRAMNDIEATVGVLKAQLAEVEKRGIKRQAIQNLIIDSSEGPNRFTPRYARVMKIGKGELQGKRVRVTQEGRNFGKIGTVVDSYNTMNEVQDRICIVDVGTFPHILAHEDHLEVVEGA
ncbi:DNA polymerase III subunit epsilon, partial [Bacillus cereus]